MTEVTPIIHTLYHEAGNINRTNCSQQNLNNLTISVIATCAQYTVETSMIHVHLFLYSLPNYYLK